MRGLTCSLCVNSSALWQKYVICTSTNVHRLQWYLLVSTAVNILWIHYDMPTGLPFQLSQFDDVFCNAEHNTQYISDCNFKLLSSCEIFQTFVLYFIDFITHTYGSRRARVFSSVGLCVCRSICGSVRYLKNRGRQHHQTSPRNVPPWFLETCLCVFKRSLSHDMGFCSLGRVPHNQPRRLVVWHSGRMSICDRRIFPVLRSTCSWWVTIYVGKSSATRSANWANSAFQPFEVDKWVVSCNRMCTTSLRWRNLVNAYGVKAGWFIQFADKRVGGR